MRFFFIIDHRHVLPASSSIDSFTFFSRSPCVVRRASIATNCQQNVSVRKRTLGFAREMSPASSTRVLRPMVSPACSFGSGSDSNWTTPRRQ
jgi:hypothetical protein